MNDFIDLEGASGAKYRFRLWPEGRRHPPMAGNFVCIRGQGKRATIVHVGETLDLSSARDQLAPEVAQQTTYLYTRLNISRAIRNAEHQDLAARYEAAGAGQSAEA